MHVGKNTFSNEEQAISSTSLPRICERVPRRSPAMPTRRRGSLGTAGSGGERSATLRLADKRMHARTGRGEGCPGPGSSAVTTKWTKRLQMNGDTAQTYPAYCNPKLNSESFVPIHPSICLSVSFPLSVPLPYVEECVVSGFGSLTPDLIRAIALRF